MSLQRARTRSHRHGSSRPYVVQELQPSRRARCRYPGRPARLGDACTRLGAAVALSMENPLPDAVTRVAPGNPHAFPRIRIWRGRRVLAPAADVLGRATATSNEAPNDE